MQVLITPFIAVVLVLLLTPLVQKAGQRFGYVDRPDPRKVHRQPIVRIGGVAIWAGTLMAALVGVGLLGVHPLPHPETLKLVGLLLGGCGFFLIGLSDDLLNLSPFVRLGLQAIVTIVVWNLGIRVDHLPIPLIGTIATDFWSLPITFLWLAGVANAMNWIDGLDGLAGGVGAIAAGTLGLLCWQEQQFAVALVAFALAGACLGFLRYNLNPARIFMGDGGSYCIGFTLAAVSAIGLMASPSFTTVLLPYGVLAVPVGDMALVILLRLADKKSPFFPDQRHLHHRLLHLGFSPQGSVRFIHSLSLWLGSWAITAAGVANGTIAVGVASLLLVVSSQSFWQHSFHRSSLPVAIGSSPHE